MFQNIEFNGTSEESTEHDVFSSFKPWLGFEFYRRNPLNSRHQPSKKNITEYEVKLD